MTGSLSPGIAGICLLLATHGALASEYRGFGRWLGLGFGPGIHAYHCCPRWSPPPIAPDSCVLVPSTSFSLSPDVEFGKQPDVNGPVSSSVTPISPARHPARGGRLDDASSQCSSILFAPPRVPVARPKEAGRHAHSHPLY